MTTLTTHAAHMGREPAAGLVVPRKAKPVKWFAALGAACIAVQIYVYGRWILSGDLRPTANGPDPMPGWMHITAVTIEIVGLLGMLACAWFLVVRPKRRDGELSIWGIAFFAVLTSYWLDDGANFANHMFTFNPALVNFGSWYSFVPGWISPRAEHLAEPILFLAPAYTYGLVLPVMLMTLLMGAIRRRWPQLGNVGLISAMSAVAAIGLFIGEGLVFVRVGMYTLAGTIPSLTLFAGEYYQYPIYEPLVAGPLFFVTPAALLFFKNDKGESLLERGLSSIRVTRRQRAGVRFLALSGVFNLTQIIYAVTFSLISILPSFTWASDIVQNRSYFRNELCGEGTPYACPGADVPIPRVGGAHLGPDGKLVEPD